ncbi:MAG: nitrilase-related carbon-nitrogen hydrolase, partial [Bacteroidota bacterium]
MKIALAQINYHIGNFESNTSKIIDGIKKGEEEGVDIVVFSELAISGYPPRDFLEFNNFIEECLSSVVTISKYCTSIAAIVGLPTFNTNDKGKPLFNSAAFLADGKIKSIINKTLLPNYDIFDENRYFEPNNTFNIVEYLGKKIAITICEDLWNVQDNPLYTINPMDKLMGQNPDLMINIAASPFNYHQTKIRKEVLRK